MNDRGGGYFQAKWETQREGARPPVMCPKCGAAE